MRQLILFILVLGIAAVTIWVFQDIAKSRKFGRENAFAIVGLLFALLPFAMLLPRPTVEFKQTEFTVQEDSNAGEQGKTLTIEVRLNYPQLMPVRVNYETQNGLDGQDAATLEDFNGESGELQLAFWKPSASITIETKPDALDEPDELITLELHNPRWGDLGDMAQSAIKIEDNDNPPTISFEKPLFQQSEPLEEEISAVPITVTLDKPSGQAVEVHYKTMDEAVGESALDYAEKDVDYKAIEEGVIHFEPGSVSQTFEILISRDQNDENTEAVDLLLFNQENAHLGEEDALTVATLQIEDSNELPTLNFNLAEGEGISVSEEKESATIGLSLSLASDNQISVNYITTDKGTAVAGTDFNANSGILEIPGNERGASFDITWSDDDVDEPDKTIILELPGAEHAKIEDGVLTLTIIDDDDPPQVNFRDNVLRVQEEAGDITIPVQLSTKSDFPIDVTLEITPDRAEEGKDFDLHTETLTIPPGEIEGKLEISIIDDLLKEPEKQLLIALQPTDGRAASGDFSTLALIIEDELDTKLCEDTEQLTGEIAAANMRSGPNGGSAVLGAITQDDILGIIEWTDTAGGWFHVIKRSTGQDGWIGASGISNAADLQQIIRNADGIEET